MLERFKNDTRQSLEESGSLVNRLPWTLMMSLSVADGDSREGCFRLMVTAAWTPTAERELDEIHDFIGIQRQSPPGRGRSGP